MQYPSVVHQLEETLRVYKSTEVPRGNKPIDPRADPKYFGYTWTNWWDYVSHEQNSNPHIWKNDVPYYVDPELIYT